MASLRQWLVGVLQRLIDRVDSSESNVSLGAAANQQNESERASDDSSPISHELRSLKDDFSGDLRMIASQVQADVRYNRDFLGDDALTQRLKGDSPIDRYPSQLNEVRKRLLGVYGKSVPAYSASGAAKTGEFQVEAVRLRIDVNCFVILSTAVGLADAAGRVLTRDRRTALAGNLMFLVWRESSEAISGIVRRYYEQISRAEFCAPVSTRINIADIFGTHNEELAALLKDAAKIAERLSATTERSDPSPVDDDYAPAAHTILMDLLTTYRSVDRRSLMRLSHPFVPGVLGVAILSAVVVGVLLAPDQVVLQIAPRLPLAVRRMVPGIVGGVGVAAFTLALTQSVQLARRRAMLFSLRATIRSMIRTGTILYGDASNFFVRFGEPIRRRFLPPRN